MGLHLTWNMGSLKNFDRYYSKNFFWKETVDHPNKDEFWKKSDILPHLKGMKHAFMTVGGWFDAEDSVWPFEYL
jgi:predicted acyl esterase